MFIRTKFHINRLTQTYFTAFLYVLSDHPSYIAWGYNISTNTCVMFLCMYFIFISQYNQTNVTYFNPTILRNMSFVPRPHSTSGHPHLNGMSFDYSPNNQNCCLIMKQPYYMNQSCIHNQPLFHVRVIMIMISFSNYIVLDTFYMNQPPKPRPST